jgi:hypothetical protein
MTGTCAGAFGPVNENLLAMTIPGYKHQYRLPLDLNSMTSELMVTAVDREELDKVWSIRKLVPIFAMSDYGVIRDSNDLSHSEKKLIV